MYVNSAELRRKKYIHFLCALSLVYLTKTDTIHFGSFPPLHFTYKITNITYSLTKITDLAKI